MVEEGLHVSKLEKKQWIILLGAEIEPKRQLKIDGVKKRWNLMI